MIEVAITVPWQREIHFDHDQVKSGKVLPSRR